MSVTDPIDAFLLVSFGGPEAPEEVIPFLERVTAGRNIPRERLELVGEHYFARGGVSPINEQCRDLLSRIEPALRQAGLDLPIYWGNRNSAPFLDDTIAQMHADGIKHAVAFVTSAYSSYSGCRQYRENIAAALELVGTDAPAVEKLRVFFNHPGFVEPLADGLSVALAGVDASTTRVIFTAHSIPTASANTCDYEQQIRNAAELVAARVAQMPEWSVAWQSRSGPPSMPWLEPDIGDVIRGFDTDAASASQVTDVVVVPIGFVSDHMEVIQDLDTDAAAAAAEVGLGFTRVATSSTDVRFIEMIVDLVAERVEGVTPVALGELGLVPTSAAKPVVRRQCALLVDRVLARRPDSGDGNAHQSIVQNLAADQVGEARDRAHTPVPRRHRCEWQQCGLRRIRSRRRSGSRKRRRTAQESASARPEVSQGGAPHPIGGSTSAMSEMGLSAHAIPAMGYALA